MPDRRYHHFCGLARALDVIGDRWNLLIVRELLVGPRRYSELADGLPGVATNLLAGRLRDLEAAEVVQRRPAESRGVVYALTDWGAELREAVDALIRWSTPLMVSGPRDADAFHVEWFTVALRALLHGATAVPPVAAELDVEGRRVRVTVDDTGPEISLPDPGGDAPAPRMAAATCLGLFTGVLALEEAQARGLVTGDADALRPLLDVGRARNPQPTRADG